MMVREFKIISPKFSCKKVEYPFFFIFPLSLFFVLKNYLVKTCSPVCEKISKSMDPVCSVVTNAPRI